MLKALLAFLFFAFIAAQQPCCISTVASGIEGNYDKERHLAIRVLINYDFVNKLERFDVTHFKGAQYAYSVIVDWTTDATYTFNSTNCEVREVEGNMQQLCVPSTSKYEGAITIGPSLPAYMFVDRSKHNTLIETVVDATGTCWPITSVIGQKKIGTDVAEFWNWQNSLSQPNIFTVPSNCLPLKKLPAGAESIFPATEILSQKYLRR